ncbi:MAG: LAGLIDADG family homing endonuclease, partial [Candidatus Aenigmatarchaeota archaeon]
LLKKLFDIEPFVQSRNKVKMLRAVSINLKEFTEALGGSVLGKSYEKSLPGWASTLPPREIAALLRGLFDAEGSVNYKFGTVTFSTTSKKLAQQVQTMCQSLGIIAGLYDDRSLGGGRKRQAFKVQISSARNIVKFHESIGLSGKKGEKLAMLASKKSVSSKWDHIPNIMGTVEETKKLLRLSDTDCAGYILTDVRRRDFISRPLLSKVVSQFQKRLLKIEALSGKLKSTLSQAQYRELREKLRISRSEIARSLGVSQQDLWYWMVVKGDPDLLKKSILEARRITEHMLTAGATIDRLKTLVDSPTEWVAVKHIDKINKKQMVYDIEVNPTKTFIGNGIVCHNSVSIAKASIVATLPAKTSVLAGGNPKFSRFDPYMPIAKQINIPDSLLSRFDLKFVLRDIPDTKQDTKIVQHILSSREDDYLEALPKLDSGFIRKYITYAKRYCSPILPKETGQMMKKFYVDTRKKAQKDGGAIPITLRQFEALIRMAEASAKIQLSPTVRKKDADRAIRLMKYSLEQLGLVSETGEIDIDKFEGATTTSKDRSSIRVVLDIINELSKAKKEILSNDVVEEAKKQDVNDAEDVIERLKREGMLFEPSPGYIQKV